MIDKNIGNIERVLRIIISVVLAVFVFLQPEITGVEIFVLVAALSLVLNGVFSRCFFWWALGINSLKPHPSECRYN